MVGNRRQGWALYAAMLAMLVVDDRRRLRRRAERLARAEGGRARARLGRRAPPAATWRARSSASGSPTAPSGRRSTTAASNGSVNSSHDSYTGIGGTRAAEHDDRGGDLRRGRLGPLRDAAVRPAGGVHRRADGRAHARVPGQEDRGARGEAGPDRDAGRAAARARSPPRSRSRPKYGDPSIYNPGPQGFSETLYAYTSQGNNNGSAFAGYTGFLQPNAPGNVGAYGITFADLLGGVSMLIGALRAAARGARGRRLARRQAGRAARAPAPSAPTRRPSSSC